jgi:hypothetical protein
MNETSKTIGFIITVSIIIIGFVIALLPFLLFIAGYFFDGFNFDTNKNESNIQILHFSSYILRS